MQKEETENRNGWKYYLDNVKKRIYNAYYRHWKILFLILVFYLILLGLIWNPLSYDAMISQSGGNNNQSEQMAIMAEEMNPTGTVKQRRATGKAMKALASPFETTFNAMWWILNQLGSLIAIILILIIVPSVPIVLYAGALYMVISMMLDKVKKI